MGLSGLYLNRWTPFFYVELRAHVADAKTHTDFTVKLAVHNNFIMYAFSTSVSVRTNVRGVALNKARGRKRSCDVRHWQYGILANTRRVKLNGNGYVRMLNENESVMSGKSIDELQSSLMNGLKDMNRGLDIDADAETMNDDEAYIEDVIELLEDEHGQFITGDYDGDWELIYTSSGITRYFGGVTGLQRLLPNGSTQTIIMNMNREDGKCQFTETITFDAPIFGKQTIQVIAQGDVLLTPPQSFSPSEQQQQQQQRVNWDPKTVQIAGFNLYAENWKTLRAFQIGDVTFMDGTFRILRGQTGSVHVFRRVP